jgi:SAM-dependent methyltransferase
MGGFSDDWLQLRASADARARADRLLGLLPKVERVVDLGAGTGGNLRHLAPRLPGRQDWLCVDVDATLLALLSERTRAWAEAAGQEFAPDGDAFTLNGPDCTCRVRCRVLDLSTELDRLKLPPGALVSASAMLDLVSADWLEGLIGRAAEARCPLLFVLTYDGRVELNPPIAGPVGDADVIARVNRHQRTDKGFGPALGPDATAEARSIARRLGYRVHHAASDWHLGPDQAALQRALIEGWHAAALAMGRADEDALGRWRQHRMEHVRAGSSRADVGHQDLLLIPIEGDPVRDEPDGDPAHRPSQKPALQAAGPGSARQDTSA